MRFLLASVIASLKKAYELCRQPNLIHTVGVRVGGIKSACPGRRNYEIERAIRPFAVARKAWLFANTPAGAKASALLYSLVESAKANGKEPYAWLCYVLERLPLAQNADDYEALLPWNIHDEDLAMNLVARESSA